MSPTPVKADSAIQPTKSKIKNNLVNCLLQFDFREIVSVFSILQILKGMQKDYLNMWLCKRRAAMCCRETNWTGKWETCCDAVLPRQHNQM